MKLNYQYKTYSEDGRPKIEELYKAFYALLKNKNWNIHVIDKHSINKKRRKLQFPVISLTTKNCGKAVWIIGGIHGEEPAGPVAISKNLNLFKRLAERKTIFVILPLCNPSGYFRNWRYLNHWKDWRIGKSIGDCEHLLLKNNKEPRVKKPISKKAKVFTDYLLNLSEKYPPLLVIDLHEDNPLTAGEGTFYPERATYGGIYIYSQGKLGNRDPIAREIIKTLLAHKHPIINSGNAKTRFKEKIVKGIVSGVKDGSIDELLASEKIYRNGKIIEKVRAKSVIVVETITTLPLKKRVEIHSEILKKINKFVRLANSIQ